MTEEPPAPEVNLDPVLEQWRGICQELKHQIDTENNKYNEFFKRQDKVNVLREQETQRLNFLKQDLRGRVDKQNDLYDDQDRKIKIYQEKFRHLIQENQEKSTTGRLEAETQLKSQLLDQSLIEQENRQHIRFLLKKQKEQTQKHNELVLNLRSEQEKKITEMRQKYTQKTNYLKNAFEEKTRILRAKKYADIVDEIQMLQSKKDHHINNLISAHLKEFNDIKIYYDNITHANLDLIRSLKGEVAETSNKEKEKEQSLMDVLSIYRQYAGPLKKHLEDIENLKVQQQFYVRDKKELSQISKRINKFKKESEEIEWKVELLKQTINSKKKENNVLEDSLQKQLQKVQQKQGYKQTLLKEKTFKDTKEISKIECVLNDLSKNYDLKNMVGEDIISGNADTVVKTKDNEIQQLQEILQERKERYYNAIHFYESAMKRHNIPLDELGFIPKTI